MQRPSWVWTALPPDARTIVCLGDDAGLADALREVGLSVSEAPADGQADAVLVARPNAEALEAAARAARDRTTRVTAVAVGPSASPSLRPVPRALRGLQLLASPLTALATDLAARRLTRAFRRSGLEATRVTTGDRSLPRYGLGPGGWLGRRRLPGGAIVIGSTAKPPVSVVDEVIAAAAHELGRPLRRVAADVFPSGKLALQLVDPDGRRYFLSIVAAAAGGPDRSEIAVRAILAARPAASLRDRIVQPLAAGTVGLVRYVLEESVPGRHPVWVSHRLWDDCIEFLVAVHELPRRAPDVALPPAWPDLETAADILARRSGGTERAALERVHREVANRLAGVVVGGGHGDLFTKNLLVRRSRLRAVLDWEWAARDSLPLLDLLDLRAQLGLRRRRGLRVGENLTEVLLPLATRGGDRPVREYCAAVGVPADPATLEGLTLAHWIMRTARLGSIDPRRLADAGWMRANVHDPLVRVGEALGRRAITHRRGG